MQKLEQLSQFHAAHGLQSGSATCVSVEGGAVWLAEVGEHRWAVSFYPYRSDHPDAPVAHIQVGEEELGGAADADAAEAWARQRFEGRDPREFVVVALEEEADELDVELVQALLDDAGTPAIVRPTIGRRSAELLPWIIVLKVAQPASRERRERICGMPSKAWFNGCTRPAETQPDARGP